MGTIVPGQDLIVRSQVRNLEHCLAVTEIISDENLRDPWEDLSEFVAQ